MMNKRYNNNARVLSNTARHFADRLKNEKRLTIAQALKEWNHIIQRSNHHGVSDAKGFALTGNYTRKAVLITALNGIADYLFEQAQAKETVYDVEAAHAEALQIDSQMHQDEFSKSSAMMQGVWVNLNHAEAVEINAAHSAQLAFLCHTAPYKAMLIKWAHQDALELNRAFDIEANKGARSHV